jgi:hypothetical protein
MMTKTCWNCEHFQKTEFLEVILLYCELTEDSVVIHRKPEKKCIKIDNKLERDYV